MKTKIATALSLVGVLGAGSAAALVNTQILDSGPSGADTTSILSPSSTDVTVPTTPAPTQPTTTPATTTQPSTTAATTTVVVTVPATTPSTGYLTSYNLAPAGVVTVDVLNGSTIIIAHTPSAGWDVVAAEDIVAELRSTVTFSDGITNVNFEVRLVDGVLVPTVTSTAVAPSTTTGNTVAGGGSNTSTTIDDDDDDDHDDDDHDDDDDDHDDDDDDDDDDHDDD